MKKVIVTGVTGQDGSHMVDYLLKNYHDIKIYGVVREKSVSNNGNINHVKDSRFETIEADIIDPTNMSGIISSIKPDYFVNFAANSFVGKSWDKPSLMLETNAKSVIYQLEAIRSHSPNTRYYQAGSSEEFGDVVYSPQDEKHPLRPRSPYGAAKAAARHIVKVYRESYNLYAIQGWLFNHEGTRRGSKFVTRKITKGVAAIYHAIQNNIDVANSNANLKDFKKIEPIRLGNLEAKRDWSDAIDFVDGVWRMLNQELLTNTPWDTHTNPEENIKYLSTKIKEYVLASGETHSIREFIEEAFAAAGIKIIDVNVDKMPPSETGDQINYTLESGEPVIVVTPEFYRPSEVNLLLGDSTNIRKDLNWVPLTGFKDLVKKMVSNDINLTIH